MLRVTLRNLFAHKLRLLLTGLSVVIGVGFLAGTLVFTDTLKATFNDLIGRTSKNLSVVVRAQSDFSSTDIGASSTRALVPASLVASVKATAGVADAVGAVQGNDLLVTSAGKAVVPKSPGPPTLAVSWTPSNFGSLAFVQGRGPVAAGEVAIDKAAADDFNLHVGDPVTVQTQGPPLKATIVGIATVGGSSNLAGAVLSVFDPATAQQVTGKPGFVNQIDVHAASGVSQDTLAKRIGATLPKGFEAVTGAAVNKEQSAAINKVLGFFNIFLGIFAGVALFVGLFIILNTFTMLVAQRTRELALLRAIGASRRQVMSAVLGESFIVGIVASTVGLVFGIVVAIGVRALLSAVGVSMPGWLAHSEAAYSHCGLPRRHSRHGGGCMVPVVSRRPHSARRGHARRSCAARAVVAHSGDCRRRRRRDWHALHRRFDQREERQCGRASRYRRGHRHDRRVDSKRVAQPASRASAGCTADLDLWHSRPAGDVERYS